MAADLPTFQFPRIERVYTFIIKASRVLIRTGIQLLAPINVGIYMRAYTRYLRAIGLRIDGTPKFISNDVYFDGSDYGLISLGDNVVISREVMFLTHDYSVTAGLAAMGQQVRRGEGELYTLRPIRVGRDCFIGARSSLLPGATLGDNVILGAGSVVVGHIPANSVAAGNPARVIADTSAWAQAKLARGDVLTESHAPGAKE